MIYRLELSDAAFARLPDRMYFEGENDVLSRLYGRAAGGIDKRAARHLIPNDELMGLVIDTPNGTRRPWKAAVTNVYTDSGEFVRTEY